LKNFFFVVLMLILPGFLSAQYVLQSPGGQVLATSDGAVIGVSMCPATITVSHLVSHGVAPVDKTVTYGVVVTNLTGTYKCWITQNLGADHQAVSASDDTEASAGWYWQFNRKQGFKVADDGVTRTPNSAWVYPLSESSAWLPENDPCTIELGDGWRVHGALFQRSHGFPVRCIKD
jgi:hypothetical protein